MQSKNMDLNCLLAILRNNKGIEGIEGIEGIMEERNNGIMEDWEE